MGFGPLRPSHAIHSGLASGAKWCYRTICATDRLSQCGDLRFKLPARGPGWSLAKEARTGDVRSGLFTTNGLEL